MGRQPISDEPENARPPDGRKPSRPTEEAAARPAVARPASPAEPRPGEPRQAEPRPTAAARQTDREAENGAPGTGDARQPAGGHRVAHDLRHQEVLRGSHPGDRFIRYSRKAGPFTRKRGGILAASLETDRPRSRWGRFTAILKRVFIGPPISTEHSIHERLTNVKALAVLSSDALSSVAYATEEILRILLLAGTSALAFGMPLGIAVMALMVIVVASYRQTILAYPRGGGTYIVAKDNLGPLAGLAAASSILMGYVLTVAVSIAAGVAALYSIFPSLEGAKVELCIGLIAFVTVANLRGLREAGNIFAVPTYLFILGMIGLIAFGLLRMFLGIGGSLGPADYVLPDKGVIPPGAEALGILLLLRAFTQGAAALTGVEAIADGVPAFKPPEYVNARRTLLYMGVIAVIMFGGITFLATQLQIQPSESETVVSQIARTVFGRNALWFFVQVTTSLILILAANTAFADFPRLGYFLARDKYMPHQYSFRGDRLAFSWGIVTLALLASLLVVAFGGETSALIPLYAIGVMGAFTFSQSGMVMRWWKLRPPGWQRNLLMNGVGAVTTLTVLIVATFTKLDKGTWLAVILIPVQMALFLAINRHYARVEQEVAAQAVPRRKTFKHTFIVPVSRLNSVALAALDYARSLSTEVNAVHIVDGEDPDEPARFRAEWDEHMRDSGVNLVIIESPYRSLIGPLLSYIDAIDQQDKEDTITVILPEFLPKKPWEYLLHNQSALRLKASLLFRPNTVVADVPFHLGAVDTRRAARMGQSLMRGLPWVVIVVLGLLLALLYYVLISK